MWSRILGPRVATQDVRQEARVLPLNFRSRTAENEERSKRSHLQCGVQGSEVRRPMTASEKFRKLLERDARYDIEAYNFVYEALDHTLKHVVRTAERNQHVTGSQLLEGVRQLGVERFGCLARCVFECWGVRTTQDFGQIVFNLIDHDLMGKQDSDRAEDFQGVYDFAHVFDITPLFHYSRRGDEWKASYVTRSELARLK